MAQNRKATLSHQLLHDPSVSRHALFSFLIILPFLSPLSSYILLCVSFSMSSASVITAFVSLCVSNMYVCVSQIKLPERILLRLVVNIHYGLPTPDKSSYGRLQSLPGYLWFQHWLMIQSLFLGQQSHMTQSIVSYAEEAIFSCFILKGVIDLEDA